MKNLANANIQKMKPYCPPLEGRRNYGGVLCDFNERTIPPSKKVLAAVHRFVGQNKLQIYPEYDPAFVKKLARYAGVKAAHVMITNGSDQGIDIIFRTFTQAGDTVVIPSPSFAMFYQCAEMIDTNVIAPPFELPNLAFPFEKVFESIEKGAKFIIVCNPNNPTGTIISPKEIEEICKKALAKGAAVYVDEAYYEFSGVTAVPLISKYPNLIITRTFSKAFGFPSLRVGYAISNETTILELKKVCGPYDVNMAGVAAAMGALDDVGEMKKYAREVMNKAKPLVEDFFKKQKIHFFPSGSNFILFKPRYPASAERTLKILKAGGVLVRPRSGPNIDGTLRVSIGTVAQMKKFIYLYKKKVLRKIAFLDRDGALIFEPQDTFQIDSREKLQILPDVISGLRRLMRQGFDLVMVSNQDGLGTASFPRKYFEIPHKRMLAIFQKNGIRFAEIFVCPHRKEDGCPCRKPKIGLVQKWIAENELDYADSFMYGDRETDRQFAQNLGIRFVKATTNQPFKIIL